MSPGEDAASRAMRAAAEGEAAGRMLKGVGLGELFAYLAEEWIAGYAGGLVDGRRVVALTGSDGWNAEGVWWDDAGRSTHLRPWGAVLRDLQAIARREGR